MVDAQIREEVLSVVEQYLPSQPFTVLLDNESMVDAMLAAFECQSELRPCGVYASKGIQTAEEMQQDEELEQAIISSGDDRIKSVAAFATAVALTGMAQGIIDPNLLDIVIVSFTYAAAKHAYPDYVGNLVTEDEGVWFEYSM